MKRIAIALLASAAALAANTDRADTRVSIGVNVGTPVYRAPVAAVVVAPVPRYAPAPVVVAAPSRGYWKEVSVKTWVPERVSFSRDRWGRSVRVVEPGYYTYRTDRVWVDGRHDNGNHYGRDRGYSYDNHDRNRWGR
jgi:hypothetical protein